MRISDWSSDVCSSDLLGALGEDDLAGDVGGAEVELRTIVGEERRVTAAFVLRQDVHFRGEFGVRGDRTRLRVDLATLHLFTADAADQRTDVVAVLTLVEQLADHFDAGDGRILGLLDAGDCDFLADLDDAGLYTPRDDLAATLEHDHALDRHTE